MTREDALSYIHKVDWRGSVPGLSRIDTLLGMLGHPERAVKYIHITGTNGKGSTCAMLAAILRQETWFVLGEDETLANAGYLCWSPSLSFQTISNATTVYNSLIQSGESASAPLRLLFRTQTDASALAGVLNQLKADGDTFLAVRETKY